MESTGERTPAVSQSQAQQIADRIRMLRQELSSPELRSVLDLTSEQRGRFDQWSQAQLDQLARQFDVDTSVSQKRISWGMRIASTLGGIAICAALVLFFQRYWGYLDTWVQVLVVMVVPLLALAGAEFASTRERTLYFTGLLSLVAFAAFVMNLAVLGDIFNINSTERALLAWGAFALALAYRYRLRLPLTMGLLLLISYGAATVTVRFGYRWFDFFETPEVVAVIALVVFSLPIAISHPRHDNFPAVYRLAGSIVFFLCMLSLADWGASSYLRMDQHSVERLYEVLGLLTSAGAIWLGIRRYWNGVVNVSSAAFALFLFTRLYRWWWEWMPKYLFFAAIGAIGIGLVLAFKRLRSRMSAGEVPA